MKIAFMGTPDFAVPTLQKLMEAGHDVVLAVTKPDAVANRGKKITFSPVKECALEAGVPVAQPEKVKGNEAFVSELKALAPDAIVVVAYGKILPKEILEIPRLGCFNVHGSLLPKLRGPAPVQWSVINGEETTGVTIMYMAEGMDTGDMLLRGETPVDGKTAGELSDELSAMGADLMAEALVKAEEGTLEPEKQDDSLATYAPFIFKKDGLMDFTGSAEELERRCRGLSPWPGTYTYLDGELFKVWACEAFDEEIGAEKAYVSKVMPGTIIEAGRQGIDVSCGRGYLRLTLVQAPGKKRMTADEYLRGNHIEIGTVLGYNIR